MIKNPHLLKLDRGIAVSDELADAIVRAFSYNYPESYSDIERSDDLKKRNSPEKVRGLLDDGVIYILLDTKKKVLALLEWKHKVVVEWKHGVVEGGICVFLDWLIVDESARGNGLAKYLHDFFEGELRMIRRRTEMPMSQLISVHTDNPAINLFEKWGYVFDPRQRQIPGRVYMTKNVR